MDHVLEFAHVARPLVVGQDGHGHVHDDHALAVFGRVLLQEMFDQGRHVLRAFAQGGDGHGGHVQAVVEVPAEGPVVHAFRQVLVGGGDDPHIDFARSAAADAHDLAVLEHAQQAGLHGQGQLADLVEEDRPAVGQFEIPGLALARRPGEGAGHVPEHLGLGQGLGDAAAVDFQEDLVLALAVGVGQPGEHILADAGFAQDEHRGVRRGHGLQHVHDLLHGLAREHGGEGLAAFIGDEGYLFVEMVDELALFFHLLVQARDHGDVAHEGHHQAQDSGLVENREA